MGRGVPSQKISDLSLEMLDYGASSHAAEQRLIL